MESFEKLQNKMMELEIETEHKGYYYKVSDALTIMICGMLFNLQNISDIHDLWSNVLGAPLGYIIYKILSKYSFVRTSFCKFKATPHNCEVNENMI